VGLATGFPLSLRRVWLSAAGMALLMSVIPLCSAITVAALDCRFAAMSMAAVVLGVSALIAKETSEPRVGSRYRALLGALPLATLAGYLVGAGFQLRLDGPFALGCALAGAAAAELIGRRWLRIEPRILALQHLLAATFGSSAATLIIWWYGGGAHAIAGVLYRQSLATKLRYALMRQWSIMTQTGLIVTLAPALVYAICIAVRRRRAAL
jgi:hypothetical protein